ncbi:MAG: proline--tRNA ligase [Acidobacteria bacterium]|nr:MAG: proline--tRNA ligase [Acidobacteriota bacterium]
MAEVKITKRSEDYSRWYTDVIAAAELADYAPVKGCMIIRPNGYAIWEKMQQALDGMFKETGHQNAYFPLFIPESFLRKEAEHVEGFAPEVAVVTHGGGSKLEEPLVIRPTSETIIWNSYRNWIQSYRDLPLLINQWCNVVRWEMRTRLFLRTAEFLWQEGHTAHATYEEAEEETLRMLGVYRRFAEEFMALPVIEGRKTEKEKFAGADHTYSIEAMMGDAKALQAGTSHHLAQNFAKAFDVTFQTEKGTREYVYATSWGLSTRMIGALIMAHGDDNGIIIPPKLATTQVVVVPISRKPEERQHVMRAVEKFTLAFKTVGIGFKVDDREQYSPGFKFNDWEKRGVPLRIEVGPKDLDKNQVVLARRDNREKTSASQDGLERTVVDMLNAIQKSLYERALEFREKHTYRVDDYGKFPEILDGEGGFIWSHWCGSGECEERVKDETKATIRNIPRESPAEEGKCIKCGSRSERRVIFARAY